ncbi:MAG: hypothetical protein WCT05_07265 [Lentisphaeria bacterium]
MEHQRPRRHLASRIAVRFHPPQMDDSEVGAEGSAASNGIVREWERVT